MFRTSDRLEKKENSKPIFNSQICAAWKESLLTPLIDSAKSCLEDASGFFQSRLSYFIEMNFVLFDFSVFPGRPTCNGAASSAAMKSSELSVAGCWLSPSRLYLT